MSRFLKALRKYQMAGYGPDDTFPELAIENPLSDYGISNDQYNGFVSRASQPMIPSQSGYNPGEIHPYEPLPVDPEVIASQLNGPVSLNLYTAHPFVRNVGNGSIIDYIKANSKWGNSSLSDRKELGKKYGISNVGTSEGNLALLRKLQQIDGFIPEKAIKKLTDKRSNKDKKPKIVNETGYDQSLIENLLDKSRNGQLSEEEYLKYKNNIPGDISYIIEQGLNKQAKDRSKPKENSLTGFFNTNYNTLPKLSKPIPKSTPKNPITNLVPDSYYKTKVLNGEIKGRNLKKLLDEGTITKYQYNQLYSLIRANGLDI